ncbi:uncharacterized protein LOC100573415 [Acyrthosiphon pisum]|uniref:Uncharacterized protein n=1 Tax=Acyrthosiphon pisum TaxID=7029 RepID=A0A8R2NTQ8_ACYPI|nr:uncharacterized protein LOC100573415 [Acyrthosiphon pisum]|eukprot:XP_016657758.1 PREDICTED: uncharacterized protein LOC100573415 isoform X1 [Acyrthosiphon pisum]
MVGRERAVPPSNIIDAVLTFKERVVLKNGKNEMYIVAATNRVWTDIRFYIGDRMCSNAIHTFVQKGRHGIMEKLGFPLKFKQSCEIVHTPILPDDEESPDDYSSDNEDDALPCKKCEFTVSSEEWDQIQPQEKVFKLIDKSHPMQSTRSYYFCLKVHGHQYLLMTFGHTFNCLVVYLSEDVKFIPVDRYTYMSWDVALFVTPDLMAQFLINPLEVLILMHSTFRGDFQEAHKSTKKRRMIGPAMEKAILHQFVSRDCQVKLIEKEKQYVS